MALTLPGTRRAEALLATVAAGNRHGQMAGEIAAALHWFDDGQVQQELEELVAQGVLERQGIGRGALYSMAPV